MKRIVALIASRMLFGFLGFYVLAGFIALSFSVGLLMKFGVLGTPAVVTKIANFVGHMTGQILEYLARTLFHLATNPLDLVFTLLAGYLIGRLAYAIWKSQPSGTYNGPSNLPLRGASIQSANVVQQQLAERRRRAQVQLNEQYAKFTVT